MATKQDGAAQDAAPQQNVVVVHDQVGPWLRGQVLPLGKLRELGAGIEERLRHIGAIVDHSEGMELPAATRVIHDTESVAPLNPEALGFAGVGTHQAVNDLANDQAAPAAAQPAASSPVAPASTSAPASGPANAPASAAPSESK